MTIIGNYARTWVLLMVLKFGTTGKREYFFDKFYACEQAYGTVIAVSTDVKSYLSCVTTCAEDDTCMSCIYNPISKTCKTNSGTWITPTNTSCTLDIYYGKKHDPTAVASPAECVSGSACTTPMNDVRLCDGGGTGVCDKYKGRLEVFYDNTWGTVCDDIWPSGTTTDHNANIACSMLGYSGGISHQSAYFGAGIDPILIDDLQCVGTETSIFDCPKTAWGQHNCAHQEDVGVTCQ